MNPDFARICAQARKADCPRCHAGPLEDCHLPPGELHLDRYVTAHAWGLITMDGLLAVWAATARTQITVLAASPGQITTGRAA